MGIVSQEAIKQFQALMDQGQLSQLSLSLSSFFFIFFFTVSHFVSLLYAGFLSNGSWWATQENISGSHFLLPSYFRLPDLFSAQNQTYNSSAMLMLLTFFLQFITSFFLIDFTYLNFFCGLPMACVLLNLFWVIAKLTFAAIPKGPRLKACLLQFPV